MGRISSITSLALIFTPLPSLAEPKALAEPPLFALQKNTLL